MRKFFVITLLLTTLVCGVASAGPGINFNHFSINQVCLNGVEVTLDVTIPSTDPVTIYLAETLFDEAHAIAKRQFNSDYAGTFILAGDLSGLATINVHRKAIITQAYDRTVENCHLTLEEPAMSSSSDDGDGDGLTGANDNCPNDFNPNQEDGWGSGLGDACDTDWYNTNGMGVSGFEGNDGIYRVFGNCYTLPDGDVRCMDVGQFDPNELNPGNAPQDVTGEKADGWRVIVYYLHSNHGYPVYQVNVYDENDVLVDDHLEIHVYGEGDWQWFHRGGASQYNGI